MKKILLLFAALAAIGASAQKIDFNRIQYWTGEGSSRAALVVQFNCPGQTNPGALVWGFRWNGTAPTCEEMFRAVAAGSPDLALLTQFTGDMGNTVCGVGYGPDASALVTHMTYDYDAAAADRNISFGFFEPNSSMNQSSAPGQEVYDLIPAAIEDAGTSHVIDHPLNTAAFGYPAYDYDWWTLDRSGLAPSDDYFWNAGWYKGYWSYWIGTSYLSDLGYSGLGMSSMEVHDGDIHGWKYQPLSGDGDDYADGTTGASDRWLEPNYHHFSEPAGVTEIGSDGNAGIERWFRIDGTEVRRENLVPGFYIVVTGAESRKVLVK